GGLRHPGRRLAQLLLEDAQRVGVDHRLSGLVFVGPEQGHDLAYEHGRHSMNQRQSTTHSVSTRAVSPRAVSPRAVSTDVAALHSSRNSVTAFRMNMCPS